jgi:hypothetical protein
VRGVRLGEVGGRRSSWGGLQVAGSLGNPWQIREESKEKIVYFRVYYIFLVFNELFAYDWLL